jgi:TetR/AcrR family transcriptional regulator, regulator of cefoperazone and chloramphenicol sensitivity
VVVDQELYAAGDLKAKTRIRDATLALVAERGPARTTVRAIAEQAEVSPALVLHHFTSKQGVLDEVSAWVLEILKEATREPSVVMTAADAYEKRQAALDRLLDRLPALGGYLRQMLPEASPDSLRWFCEATRITQEDLARRERSGLARRSADVETESTMLVILSMAPMLLRPFIEAALDVDLNSEAGRTRWRNAQFELLTSALYPGGSNRPVSNEPR